MGFRFVCQLLLRHPASSGVAERENENLQDGGAETGRMEIYMLLSIFGINEVNVRLFRKYGLVLYDCICACSCVKIDYLSIFNVLMELERSRNGNDVSSQD